MIRIDDRTVALTENEMLLSDSFDYLLDQGLSIPEAVVALRAWWRSGPISDEFWDYLSS